MRGMSVHITYFVHGTTTDNEQKKATGWLPGELSSLGKQQGKELGKIVSGRHFDVVFCSDLQRAVDTSSLVFGGRCHIITDARLRECNYGNLNGEDEKVVKDDLLERVDKPYPGGESYKDVEKRLADFLSFVRKDYDGKSIAIVAHQAPQLALDVLVKGKTWEQAFAEDWRNAKAYQPGWEYVAK